MGMTGGASPIFRAPYYPLSKDLRMEGVKSLESFLESEIYGGRPRVMNDGDFKVLGTWSRGIHYIRAHEEKMNF